MSTSTLETPIANSEKTKSSGSTRALVLTTAAFMVSFAAWGLIAPLAPTIREEFDLSSFQIGLLLAAPVLLGSLARIPMGIITDRIGGIAFVVLLAGLTIPLVLLGLSTSYPMLLAAAFVLGIAGSSFAIGVPLVSSWFSPARKGFALGIYGMGNIGTAVTNVAAPRLEGRFGLPGTSWCFIPIVVAMALVFWFFWREPPVSHRVLLSMNEQIAIFRHQPTAWVLALFYFVTFGGFVGVSLILPTLLVEQYGTSKSEAGSWTAAFIVVATLARPAGGYLADRLASATILNVVFIAAAALAIVLAFQPALTKLMATFLVMGAIFGIGNGAVFKLVATMFPAYPGTVTGLVGSAGGLGGFFPPLVVSAVQGLTGSHAIAFMFLSEFAVVCLVVNFLVIRRIALHDAQIR